ncbi:Non-specific lipid transfer protein GPI-anchored 4-like protein [Drosera capensis]
MAVLTTRSSWTPSVVMILIVIISFSSFDVLNAKKSPAHSPSHSSAPVPVPVSPSVPVPGPGPVSPIVPGPAPGPSGPDCVSILSNAVDCIDYLTPGNTSSDPGAACCNETNQLLKFDGGGYCLCELLANPDESPLPVSVTQAWKLPNRCGISGSPAVLCSLIGVHVTAPPGIAPTASPPAPEPSVSPAPTVNPPSPAAPPPSGASATSIGLFALAFSVASVSSLLSSHMFF